MSIKKIEIEKYQEAKFRTQKLKIYINLFGKLLEIMNMRMDKSQKIKRSFILAQ